MREVLDCSIFTKAELKREEEEIESKLYYYIEEDLKGFYSEIISLIYKSITIDELIDKIKNRIKKANESLNYENKSFSKDLKKYSKNIDELNIKWSSYFLDQLDAIKSGKLTARQFEEKMDNEIHNDKFKLRDIEDFKNKIVREPFYPEKLIGETIIFKPYTPENHYDNFKIEGIKSHYPTKDKLNKDFEMVVYNISNNTIGDSFNSFPIREEVIRELIHSGTYFNDFDINRVTYTLMYKIKESGQKKLKKKNKKTACCWNCNKFHWTVRIWETAGYKSTPLCADCYGELFKPFK